MTNNRNKHQQPDQQVENDAVLPSPSERFKGYIQAIGKGHRSGRSLSIAEATDAMQILLDNKVTGEQRGAFLMLLRVREETPEEIAGFLIAARKHNTVQNITPNIDLDMACYAGKRRHLPWLILAVMCLAQTGKRIFLHGTNEPDTSRLYVSEVLKQLGIIPATGKIEVRTMLAKYGFAYADLHDINPSLHHLIQLRSEFGLRSCANTLARMLNPYSAKASLQGVYHRNLDAKHAHVAQLLNENNVVCFRGDSGEVEYNPERELEIFCLRQGHLYKHQVDALNAQWVTKPRVLNPQFLKAVWQGNLSDIYGESAVIGTLTLMLMATQEVDWNDAIGLAKHYWQQRDVSAIFA